MTEVEPPLFEPHGPPGDDEAVVRAFVRDELAPYSALLHVEGPVLLAGRDAAVALRLGPRSFLVCHEVFPDLVGAKVVTEAVLTAEGMTMYDEQTLYGPSVAVQLVGMRYNEWDLWGADIEEAFADLRISAVGGEEDLLFGGGDRPFSDG